MSTEHPPKTIIAPPPSGALPVFYDRRRRRWTHTKQILPLLLLVVAAVTAGFVLSLVSAPLLGPRVSLNRLQPLNLNPVRPVLETPSAASAKFRYKKIIGDLRKYVAAHPRSTPVNEHAFWRPTLKPFSIVAGFYVNWEASSYASFERHAGQLTHLIPEWLHLNPDGATFSSQEDPEHQFPKLVRLAREKRVAILPLINNYVPSSSGNDGSWDAESVHSMLTSPAKRTRLIAALLSFVRTHDFQGCNIDFEELSGDDDPLLALFVRNLSLAFHRYGLLVTIDVQPDQDNLEALAAAADYLVPMLYDEHNNSTTAGPIASQAWFNAKMGQFFAQVPPSRTILGVGNYAYDWEVGKANPTELAVGAAVVTAKESEGNIGMDAPSLNSRFSYYDDSDKPHDVWMLDALSAYNELHAARSWEPAGAALWVIGEEDRALWTFYGVGKLDADINPAAALSFIPGDYEVDRIGDGEILDVTASASFGRRTVRTDPHTGLIVSEKYNSYPSPWVIHTLPTKVRPKELAITFDDGPGEYTSQILDVLSRLHVPAAFFLVGNNADNYPDVVRREWAEGHEIGDHTFFHPNLMEISSKRLQYEVEATERLIEVLTGHSTRLFRAPYDVDIDPDTPREVAPLATISKMGMVTVGSAIDPKDYEAGMTPQRIVDAVIQQRDAGNIILMHDAGGDRSATVAALPIVITRLRQMGYRFVSLTDLIGGPGKEAQTRAAYFPPASEKSWSKTSDYVAFMAYFWGRRILSTLFTIAIAMGLLRVVVIEILALLQARAERRRYFDPSYCPRVSVLIAAFNEEMVVARTVDAVLRSDYPDLEVIVVDDGSTDHTSRVVWERYGDEPRVRLIRKENGGKAGALNLGLTVAAGEIIVGIDADTIFMPQTVRMLVRHFQDPEVGAVAGNVKVGNPINLLTRWQSLEYITGQNFDRRAYDYLNCITVVPGAVGAWRKSSLLEAGGYLGDTLAEDTDLTYRVRRMGAKIRTESRALAYTEAPENLADFRKQRFRWSFGTLQCLWKHRDATANPRYGAFGLVALPSLWFYAILLPLVSPVMDIMIVWSLFDRDTLARTAFYYGLFFMAELLATVTALLLDGEGLGLAFWLFFQRFFYRQLMYQIVWKSLLRAWAGTIQGWGKFARTGSVQPADPPTVQSIR